MTESKHILVKPNRLIGAILSNDLNISQRKMYGGILYKVYRELKKGSTDNVFMFNLNELKSLTGVETKDNSRLQGYLEKLTSTVISYGTVEDWGGFSLLSLFKKDGDNIKVELNSEILRALKESNYYTSLDFKYISILESKHSINLYEICKRYMGIGVPVLEIEEFRKKFSVTTKRYEDFGTIRDRVLTPSIEEINTKTDIFISYETFKTGKKITSLKFTVKHNKNIGEKDEVQEAEIIESSNLEKAILKAKKNIYVSKSWGKRVDNKINKIFKEKGEDYTSNLLSELYKELKTDIKTTLVQYINGMIVNIDLEQEEKQAKQDKKAKSIKPKVQAVEEVKKPITEPKEELETYTEDEISKAMLKACELEGLKESFLINLRKKSEIIFFNTIKKHITEPQEV